MTSLTELYCHVDDFWQAFEPYWREQQLSDGKQREREGELHPSEVMTILIHFHQARYRDFKTYYTQFVEQFLRREFPKLVSYNRFIQLIPEFVVPLSAYLHGCFGRCTGISFIDSTALAVCDNRRIRQHRVFAPTAARGKTSMGWFYGFKLHTIVNERGELLACRLTAGNVDDRQPVTDLTERVFGKLIGDKGYLSQALFEQLWAQGIQLITKLRSNMKNRLMDLTDKLLLRKRAIVETIYDQLKNISQIEHTRHRSFRNFAVHLLCGLIAYCHQPKKPSLHLSNPDLQLLIQN
jgi:transposase